MPEGEQLEEEFQLRIATAEDITQLRTLIDKSVCFMIIYFLSNSPRLC